MCFSCVNLKEFNYSFFICEKQHSKRSIFSGVVVCLIVVLSIQLFIDVSAELRTGYSTRNRKVRL